MKRFLIVACLLLTSGILLSGCLRQNVAVTNTNAVPAGQNNNTVSNTPEQTGQTVSATTSAFSTANWLVYASTTQSLEFKYPEKFPTLYLHPTAWPPKLTVASGRLICTTTSPESSSPAFEQIKSKQINGGNYCVQSLSEGAAGSIYTDYTYSTAKAGKVISLSFTIQAVQCGNYDEPQKSACETERSNFDLDNLMDEIMSSVQAVSTGNKAPVACTMEAKLCPDGSAVGRSGPDCAFAPCPGQ